MTSPHWSYLACTVVLVFAVGVCLIPITPVQSARTLYASARHALELPSDDNPLPANIQIGVSNMKNKKHSRSWQRSYDENRSDDSEKKDLEALKKVSAAVRLAGSGLSAGPYKEALKKLGKVGKDFPEGAFSHVVFALKNLCLEFANPERYGYLVGSREGKFAILLDIQKKVKTDYHATRELMDMAKHINLAAGGDDHYYFWRVYYNFLSECMKADVGEEFSMFPSPDALGQFLFNHADSELSFSEDLVDFQDNPKPENPKALFHFFHWAVTPIGLQKCLSVLKDIMPQLQKAESQEEVDAMLQ